MDFWFIRPPYKPDFIFFLLILLILLFVRREDLKIFVRLYKVRPMTAKNILFDSEMCGT